MSGDDIVKQLELAQAQHVVLTGGEPMLPKAVVETTRLMKARGFHLTIETAGTVFREVQCDLMSISPKLSNSVPTGERAGDWSTRHEMRRDQPDVIRQLINSYAYQIKFVVDHQQDCDEIEQYLERFPEIDRDRVLLMPQGNTVEELAERESWLRPYCEQTNLKFCPRKHIEWFGNQRGT